MKIANQLKRSARKAGYAKCVRLNISIDPALDSRKEELIRKFALSDFSGYIQARMRKDLGLELVA